jgi:hypothetical protein
LTGCANLGTPDAPAHAREQIGCEHTLGFVTIAAQDWWRDHAHRRDKMVDLIGIDRTQGNPHFTMGANRHRDITLFAFADKLMEHGCLLSI